MYLAVIVSVAVLGCWGSAPTIRAENDHGRELRREKYPEPPARDPGVRAGKRFLAPPIPGGASSIGNGRNLFVKVGCVLCHTPTLKTADVTVVALSNKPVNLYSDLLLHNMGPGLADDILQGEVKGDEFRTAPLWGLGQRIFFLHDGKTNDLLEAIQAHKSAGNAQFGPSEANAVIDNFNVLDERQKQDVLNFLRSL
jgi:CxxC motif-containing protein (DUF1111 family)